MKTRVCWAIAVLATASILNFSTVPSKGAVGFEFTAGIDIHGVSDFYDPLAPFGVWVDLPEYGRCWHPYVEHGWMPYSSGHWEWTDCGWYWASDEPWAWATYHYGSWVHTPIQGWLWIPALEWAPAWVVWREGPGYIGWAPCGFHGAVPAPSFFWFVDVHHFHDPIRPSALIVNNTTIINRTRVINNISRETRNFDGQRTRVVVNRGPGVDPIQRVTGRSFTPRPVREVVRQEPLPQRLQTEGRVQSWRSQGARFVPDRPQERRGEQPATTQPAPAGQSRERFNERERGAQPQPTPPPTGRDGRTQPRYQPAPAQPPAVTPQQPERALPPTGRERNAPPPGQERKIEERREPVPPAQPSEVKPPPTPERPPPVVPERPLPPTGRETQIEPRREIPPGQAKYGEERPQVRETPATQPENPAGHERGRDRERDKEKP